jgi:hypothetical protein
VLGFDAPLTIETKLVLDCPKLSGARATMENVTPVVNIILIETVLNLEPFSFFSMQ